MARGYKAEEATTAIFFFQRHASLCTPTITRTHTGKLDMVRNCVCVCVLVTVGVGCRPEIPRARLHIPIFFLRLQQINKRRIKSTTKIYDKSLRQRASRTQPTTILTDKLTR